MSSNFNKNIHSIILSGSTKLFTLSSRLSSLLFPAFWCVNDWGPMVLPRIYEIWYCRGTWHTLSCIWSFRPTPYICYLILMWHRSKPLHIDRSKSSILSLVYLLVTSDSESHLCGRCWCKSLVVFVLWKRQSRFRRSQSLLWSKQRILCNKALRAVTLMHLMNQNQMQAAKLENPWSEIRSPRRPKRNSVLQVLALS